MWELSARKLADGSQPAISGLFCFTWSYLKQIREGDADGHRSMKETQRMQQIQRGQGWWLFNSTWLPVFQGDREHNQILFLTLVKKTIILQFILKTNWITTPIWERMSKILQDQLVENGLRITNLNKNSVVYWHKSFQTPSLSLCLESFRTEWEGDMETGMKRKASEMETERRR